MKIHNAVIIYNKDTVIEMSPKELAYDFSDNVVISQEGALSRLASKKDLANLVNLIKETEN
jgi:hypothetical protein